MSSNSYSLQGDSVNFSGGNSSSNSYSLENSSGEIATGDSDSSSYNLIAGYQQSSSTVPVVEEEDPEDSGGSSNPSSSGSRRYLANTWYALGILSTTTAQVSGSMNVVTFVATPRADDILLSWRYAQDNPANRVVITRSSEFYPSSINDGKVIFEGNGNLFVDMDASVNTTYYYSIFVEDPVMGYSSGVIAKATILSRLPTPTEVIEIDEPFVETPIDREVHPQIAGLTFSDFDFIQDGRIIESTNNLIAVDGSKDLSVRLDYNSVPEILKTIAISLEDPEDSSSKFTFLLKVNNEKTAYEATIAPLNESKTYGVAITIVDHENQAQKRINGELKALGLGESGSIKFKSPELDMLRVGILVVSIIALLFIVFKIIKRYV